VSDRRRLGLRLRVDPVACDAYGFCAEMLPERITLDEWGYPIVDGAPVGADLMALARRAAAACPRRAVFLETIVSGTSPSPGPAKPSVSDVS
jgi:ferredoxin